MNKILPMAILLVACDNQLSEIDWFLGSWISDTELTMAENSYHLDLTPEGTEALREALGKLRWEVSEDSLTVIHPQQGFEGSFKYSVTVLSSSEFNLESETAGNMDIRKVGEKFCADFKFDRNVRPLLITECFARNDT